MIPKVIHYCWFGRGEKPELVIKCLKSWKEFCPDYQIIEWNEDNYDIASAPLFVRQALEAKKWAFATDYIRYQLVYEHGGIYLDTDVEVVRCLDSFLSNDAYFGFQKTSNKVASGLGFGAIKNYFFLHELMNQYDGIPFIRQDGTMYITTCLERELPVFIKHGLLLDGKEQLLENEIHIYPADYFSPYDFYTGWMKKTKNTASIHWFSASWYDDEQRRNLVKRRRKNRVRFFTRFPVRVAKKLLGQERCEKLKRLIGRG